MTLEEAFISNLVSEKIPMINQWTESIGLSIKNHTQFELKNQENYEKTGYSLLDNLTRGYLAHKQDSLKYSERTHYLLGMYLRALKELKNLNAMPLYNCITGYSVKGPKHVLRAPIISKRLYYIFINTYMFTDIQVCYSTDDTALTESKTFKIESYRKPLKLYIAENENDPDIPSDAEVLVLNDSFKENLAEFLELRVTVNSNVTAAVIEGPYDFDYNPLIGYTGAKYSPRLIEFLADVSITEDSNEAIKNEVLKKYPGKSISEVAKTYLKENNYTYDIGNFIDKRLPV